MGYSADSYVVFGIVLKKTDLIKTVKTRSCSHDMKENDNFCSVCGKPKFHNSTDNLIEDAMCSKGLSVFYSDYSSPNAILGYSLKGRSENGDDEFFKINEVTLEMQESLINFINDNNLPLTKQPSTYIFTYHSY